MSLIINATNIHQGGGRTLLLALLAEVDRPTVALLDKRLVPLPDLNDHVQVISISPNILSRLRAECLLKSLCQSDDILLCLGNLPPLLSNRASVYVFLQNRYLVGTQSLVGLPLKVRLRIQLERIILRHRLGNANLLVQTETMAREVYKHLKRDSRVLPFLPVSKPQQKSNERFAEYDYLYIASGEPHKNHTRLIEAWINLSKENFRPSLCLTLDPQTDEKLLKWIKQQVKKFDLTIVNKPMPYEQINELYKQSGALIYPSLFESFGLPLLEAEKAGLTIIASERDYVRDVISPQISFDPSSSTSIARAILRHNNIEPPIHTPLDPEEFLKKLDDSNLC